MRPTIDRRKWLLMLASSFLSSTSYGGDSSSYPLLKRGLSFHHVLNWPDTQRTNQKLSYIWPPFRSGTRQISTMELSKLHNMGFNFIRLTVDPSIFIVENSPDHLSLLKIKISETVSSIIDSGFIVIFDLHPVAVNPLYAPDNLIKGVNSPEFVAYADLVELIAAVLIGFPSNSIVFELMNEPAINQLAQADAWQPMQEELYRRARQAAPDLTLMLTGVQWSDYSSLERINVAKFYDKNVMYTFHYYEPHIFTHQGTDPHWVTQYMSGVHWPQDTSGIKEILERAKTRIYARSDLDAATKEKQVAYTARALQELADGRFDAERIIKNFKQVADWADRNSISRDQVVLGEFGCSIASNGEPVGIDRLNWLRTVRQTAEAFGFPWCFWAYKQLRPGMEFATLNGQVHAELLEPLGLKG